MSENFETKDTLPEEEEKVETPEEQTGEAEDSATEEAVVDDMTENGETAGEEAEPVSDEDQDQKPKEEKAKASEKKTKKAKKSFLKKDKKDEMLAELQDRVKRQMAEFENFRKRSEKEKSQMYDMGARSMLEKILPVIDNFERGLDGLPEDEENPFADGMKMVYKQMMTAMADAGVKEIEAVGQEFDPEKHNAVMHIDDEAYGENEIVEVMQKGYTYHDVVVRYAMVKVAN